MAFGRGGWFGVGLGGSVQKLLYLPEVHTDFIFAVVGEELGVVGTLGVLLAFAFLVWRIFHVALRCALAGHGFGAYLCYGVGLIIGLQAFINIGVALGLLPTKGLTLPLISYGSNSLVMTLAALGCVVRASHESERLLTPRPIPRPLR
jgi:cell division protein FtsW